jgi:WD40-like Beta Propeller Repeat
MKKLILTNLLLITAIVISAQHKDSPKFIGPYLGQKPPGMVPEIFAPDFISTKEYGELNAVFTKDGNEFFFSRRGVPGKYSTIMVTRQINGSWSNPEPVNFSGIKDDIDLFITPDGKSMIYCSYEEKTGDAKSYPNHDFWISNRVGERWSSPMPFAKEAISEFEDYYPIVTDNSNLYFNSQRGGPGTNDIFITKYLNGKYTKAEKLPEPINTPYREFDAFVTHDEALMIFSSEKPGGYGRSDLYISFKKNDGSWSEASNLGKFVNSEFSEYGATITSDGKYVFFTSNRNGSEDIFWGSTKIIEELKSKMNQNQ